MSSNARPRVLVLICLLALPFISQASPLQEFYSQQAIKRYFPLPQDAHSVAMAGSAALGCHSSACIFLNPAGLGRVSRLEFSATMTRESVTGKELITEQDIEQSIQQGHEIFAVPFGSIENGYAEHGTLALAYSRYLGDTDDSINTVPDGHTRSLAYGTAVNPRFSLGYSFTFYDDELRNNLGSLHSHARFLHIFGLQFRPSEDIVVGGIFRLGVGQSDTFDETFGSDGLSYPKEHGVALAITKRWDGFAASVGADYSIFDSEGNLDEAAPSVVFGQDEEGSAYNIRLGGQARIFEPMSLLLGVRWYGSDYKFSRSAFEELNTNFNSFGFSSGFELICDWFDDNEKAPRIDLGLEYLATTHGEWISLMTLTLPIAFD